jgi:ABC-type transport system involved in cytochrome c biogenesis permease subunit
VSAITFLWEICLVFYGLSNIFFLAEIWLRKKTLPFLAHLFAFCGMVVQALALVLVGIKFKIFPILNLRDALQLFAFLIMAVYFTSRLRWPVSSLGFFTATLAFLATLASYAFSARLPQPASDLSGVVLYIHISIMIVSFGIFALAFSASIAYLLQDFFLRKKHNTALMLRFPSLDTLDLLINKLVGFGFVLLSIGMALGSLWANRWWGVWWSIYDPKEELALLTWIVYAIYIHARTLSGWKGKRLVVFIVLGFLLVVATFVGASFLPGKHRFV